MPNNPPLTALKDLRISMGWTCQDMAAHLGYGPTISNGQRYARYERGDLELSAKQAQTILKSFTALTLDMLLDPEIEFHAEWAGFRCPSCDMAKHFVYEEGKVSYTLSHRHHRCVD